MSALSTLKQYMPWIAIDQGRRFYVVRDSFRSPYGPRLWLEDETGRIRDFDDLDEAWAAAHDLNSNIYAAESLSRERTDSNWIPTVTGRKFWPNDPRPEDIDIRDIAAGLANKCRYGGQLERFYSVAQHCVIGSYFCEDPLWFLLHDAAEAYLADIQSPIKSCFPQLIEMENRILKVVSEAFDLAWPMPDCVHEIDMSMRPTEQLFVMGDQLRELMEPVEVPILPVANHRKFLPRQSPDVYAGIYRQRFKELRMKIIVKDVDTARKAS